MLRSFQGNKNVKATAFYMYVELNIKNDVRLSIAFDSLLTIRFIIDRYIAFLFETSALLVGQQPLAMGRV